MDFSIIRPSAAVNLLTNPSGENATTNYTASGGSIARSATQQKRGAYSIAVTPTAGVSDGVYYGTVALTTGLTYTFSLDIWAALGVPLQIYFASTVPATLGTPVSVTGTGAWQRVEVTYSEVSSTNRRLYVVKNNSASTALFYIDGLQLEATAFSTTYCDGAQSGCSWSGVAHASTSSRAANVRSGGRKVLLSSISAYVVNQQGTGMPPVATQSQPYAGIDGSFFQKQTIRERPLTIAVSTSGNGVPLWHANREALIDLVKPDLVWPQQPFVLSYSDGGREVQLKCVYDGGLDMAGGDQEIETVAIKCLALDPYWKIDGNAGATLTVQTSLAGADYLVKRDPVTTVWSIIGSAAPNNNVQTFAYDAIRNYLYVSGDFTTIGGVAAAQGFARFDGTTWTAMNGLGVGTQLDIDVASDGTVYSTSFTGGAYNISFWNGSVWAKLGGGDFNGTTQCVMVNPINGYIYAGGEFTTKPGGGAANRGAYWNGSTWTAMGTGFNARVYDMIVGADGAVYTAGTFTTAGGVTVNGVARTANNSTFTAMGSGLSAVFGTKWALGLDGTLYLAGTYTSAGGVSAVNVAKWNGSGWSNLGAGLSTTGTRIVINPATGTLLQGWGDASGTYTFLDKFGEWNGSSWNSLDIDLPGAVPFGGLIVLPDGTIILGFATSGTAITPGVTAVTNNGSANAYPEITLSGPTAGTAHAYILRNLTTGKTIYFDLILNVNEVATLSLVPGAISFLSNYRGNLMSTIRPGSQLTEFYLAPGANSIELFLADSTMVSTMIWKERCWSIDSSGT